MRLLVMFFTLLALQSVLADRVTILPSGGAVPDAEIDDKGVIHVAYVKGEDAYYAKLESTAKAFTAFTDPIRINSEPGTVHPANMYRGPDLALGKDGTVHVIWYVNAYQRKLPQDQWGVFYSHLDKSETAFAKAINLNHKPSDNYALAADKDGNLDVVWMAGKIYVTSSRDNGKTFSAAEAIPNAEPCECCAARALRASNGTLYIDYREKGNNLRDMHLLSRSKSTGRFDNQKISSTPWQIAACPMTGTFLSAGKSLVTAWETKGSVLYARLDKDTPAELKVADRGKWPIALSAADGSVLVSWKSGDTLHWQLFDAADKPAGAVQSKSSPNSSRHAAVVKSNGDFVLID